MLRAVDSRPSGLQAEIVARERGVYTVLQLTVLLPPESMPEGRPTVTAVPSGEGAQKGPDARTPRTTTTMEWTALSRLGFEMVTEMMPEVCSATIKEQAAEVDMLGHND